MSEADNRHDTSAYGSLVAQEVVIHLPGGTELRGRESYQSFIESLFVGMPDYDARAIEVVAGGNTVFVHFEITGTHQGELFGLPASGRRVRYSGCSKWHVASGLIAEGWIYPDRAALVSQLGGG